MNNEYLINGVGGQITLTKKRIKISRKGLLGTATHGLAGDKEIPIKNITAVQYKEPKYGVNGFLQFTLMGGRESTGGVLGAGMDENTVMFSEHQTANFKEVKRYIDSIIDEEEIDFQTLTFTEDTATEENEISPKNKTIAIILSIFLGQLGVDRFYLGNIALGIGKLITFGGCGLWTIADIIYIALGKAHDGNGKKVINA